MLLFYITLWKVSILKNIEYKVITQFDCRLH